MRFLLSSGSRRENTLAVGRNGKLHLVIAWRSGSVFDLRQNMKFNKELQEKWNDAHLRSPMKSILFR
jgi:hypothetical protein